MQFIFFAKRRLERKPSSLENGLVEAALDVLWFPEDFQLCWYVALLDLNREIDILLQTTAYVDLLGKSEPSPKNATKKNEVIPPRALSCFRQMVTRIIFHNVLPGESPDDRIRCPLSAESNLKASRGPPSRFIACELFRFSCRLAD